MFRSVLRLIPRQPTLQQFRGLTTKSINSGSRSSKKTLFAGVGVAGVAAAIGTGVTLADSANKVDEQAIKDAIADLLADDPAMGPTLVRLAWHASGTYSIHTKTGGSNGAGMRFAPEASWGANAGLHLARNALEPIKKKFPGVSYSDLWILAGVTAISEMGGPDVPFRFGRVDWTSGKDCVEDGRLPNADMGSEQGTIKHIREIFNRQGFNDREMVALIGAHAIGRCHEEASGYWGPWTRAETTFSNEYFRELFDTKWTLKKTHKGKKWNGPAQFESPDGELMMLHADLALIWDPEFRKICELYKKDEEAFFKDFSAAFLKLTENGCGFPSRGWFSWLGF